MTGRWPPDPLPVGYSTLREIVANLEKAIIGREPFCAEDLAEIGAEPPQKQLEAVLADMRQRGVRGERADLEARARTIIRDYTTDRIRGERVRQEVRGALPKGDLTAVVRDSATGEIFRIPAGTDWHLAEDTTFRTGELSLKGGAPSAQHNGRLVLVREADAETFVKKWVEKNALSPAEGRRRNAPLKTVNDAELRRVVDELADDYLRDHRVPATEPHLKKEARAHFGRDIPKTQWHSCFATLDPAKRRSRGDHRRAPASRPARS